MSIARTAREWAALVDTSTIYLTGQDSNQLAQFLRRTAAELDELRADKERLDWLDSVNGTINEFNKTVYGWRLEINHNRAALTDHNLPALSVRKAIDEAVAYMKISRAHKKLIDE